MKNVDKNSAQALKKRAIRVFKTRQLMFPLIDLHTDLENSYWQAYNCSSELIQEGQYLTARYCGKKFCFECNSIRSVRLMAGYMLVLKNFKDLQFVTLTRKNVKADKLKGEVDDMLNTLRLTIHHIKKYRKISAIGVRKIEITYNKKLKSYHPHFHLLVDSTESARAIIAEWLHRNPSASGGAQHTKIATGKSYRELFKYSTKLSFDLETGPARLDVIFHALDKRRIYQPFGIKKVVSEDVTSIIRQAYGNLEYNSYKTWSYCDDLQDWISPQHEILTDTIKYFNST